MTLFYAIAGFILICISINYLLNRITRRRNLQSLSKLNFHDIIRLRDILKQRTEGVATPSRRYQFIKYDEDANRPTVMWVREAKINKKLYQLHIDWSEIKRIDIEELYNLGTVTVTVHKTNTNNINREEEIKLDEIIEYEAELMKLNGKEVKDESNTNIGYTREAS